MGFPLNPKSDSLVAGGQQQPSFVLVGAVRTKHRDPFWLLAAQVPGRRGGGGALVGRAPLGHARGAALTAVAGRARIHGEARLAEFATSLRVASPFFPGILLSRKPPKNHVAGFQKEDGLKEWGISP